MLVPADEIVLRSGCCLANPGRMAATMGAEEWAYYDGVVDAHPNQVVPLDVVVTLSVNSFLNSAARIRSVHRGLAEVCDPLLEAIPVDADLRTFDLSQIEGLLHAACQVPWVLVPVATKVLHRKRPRLVPMLDNVVLGYYFEQLRRPELVGRSQDKKRAAAAAMPAVEAFLGDLNAAGPALAPIADSLAATGTPLTDLRLLELLLWCTVEPAGYYRPPPLPQP